jgi:hypothetical protein
MKIVFAILGGILLAHTCVTTSDARPQNNRLKSVQTGYYDADSRFDRSQSKVRSFENCSVWGHYIYPCE